MSKEDIKNSLNESQQTIIAIILGFWFIIPLFKEVLITESIFSKFNYISIIIVGIMGTYLLTLNIYKNILKNNENRKGYLNSIIPIIIFMIYMIWTLISAFLAEDKENAFYGTYYRLDGYITYIGYAGFFGMAFLLESSKSKKVLLNLFIVISMINIVFFELVNRGFFSEILVQNLREEGVFYNSNHYGYYLLLVTTITNFLFVMEKQKVMQIIYGLIYAFFMYYLILNDTFGCYLSTSCSLILFFIYCIYKKQKRSLAVISIIIFILMSCCVWKNGRNVAYNNIKNFFGDFEKIQDKIEKKEGSDEAFNKVGTRRMELWKNGIKFFSEKPILGYGPENLQTKYGEVGISQDRPHNLLIQLATTSGFPGLILYVSAVGVILVRAIKTMKFDKEFQVIFFFAVVAYLMSAMFGNSMYYTSPYFFMFLGFLMHENNKEKVDL